MDQKLPYYMVYPMPFTYDDTHLERRDYEYMKSLYPDAAKRIMPYIEEECDRCDGPRSMIYDEYPDRLQLRLMCRRIYDKIMCNENLIYEIGYDTKERSAGKQEDGKRNESRLMSHAHQDWLRDFIEIMLYQELYRRRSEERRNGGNNICGRRFY